MVIVKDDIALPNITRPRSLAGVVFVEKITGHYASEGKSWQTAFQVGLDKPMAYGGAKLGDRTMVDALAPALAALQKMNPWLSY